MPTTTPNSHEIAQTHLTTLYRCEQIRSIELDAKKRLPSGALMRAAGIAATRLALSLLSQKKGRVLVLAGAGDNGGDALETAHQLAEESIDVHIILLGHEKNYSTEANQSLQRAKQSKLQWISLEECKNHPLTYWDLIIDGLFGIGLNRAIEADAADLIQLINLHNHQQKTPVLALDVPSGLNADTGQLFAGKEVAIRATHTLSFIANKVGLHTAKAKDYAGQVLIESLNLDQTTYPAPYAHLLTERSFKLRMAERQQDSHKGSYGEVLIIGGSTGMVGAPILAGRAALLCGSGRVYLGMIDKHFPVLDIVHPELMIASAQSSNLVRPVVVIGPGLSTSEDARHLLQKTLQESHTLVIDADALNLIATHEELKNLVRLRAQKKWRTILTPHPLEAARLLGATVEEIQSDRCKAAENLASNFQTCVVLKGAGSIIADSTSIWINSSGNASLATAGTGDVLSGVCAAMLAQGLSSTHAACLAVYLHGKAADNCLVNGLGPVGLSASELIPAIRTALNAIQKT